MMVILMFLISYQTNTMKLALCLPQSNCCRHVIDQANGSNRGWLQKVLSHEWTKMLVIEIQLCMIFE